MRDRPFLPPRPQAKIVRVGEVRLVGDVVVKVLRPVELTSNWWYVCNVFSEASALEWAVSDKTLSDETFNAMEVLALARSGAEK